MDQQERTSQLLQVLNDFIKLSAITGCPNCKKNVRLIGEVRKNGNWWCPFCISWFPYKQLHAEIEVPFIKLTDELDTSKPLATPFGAPLGVATVDFPMDVATGFLVPSYGSRIRKKRNILLAQAIDFTRFGRIKNSIGIWQWDLIFNERSLSEWETLISFADTQGYHIPFNFTDPFRGTTHTAFFDSDVDPNEPMSFDVINFSVKISE